MFLQTKFLCFLAMTEVVITDDQLMNIKGSYVNSILNSVNVSTLVQIAAAKLSEDYREMGATELRDAIISQNNIETWNKLVDSIKESNE